MDWQEGQVTNLKVKSTLGGDCRLRIHSTLVAKGNSTLKQASGANQNPFYAIIYTQKPRVSESASLKGIAVEKGNLYDFQAEAGKVYEFVKK